MGALFKIPGYIVYVVTGLWGFFISLGIVADHWGFAGAVIAFFVAPVTLALAPWYEALANSNWFPLLLVYGGGISASVLMAIGSAIDGE